VENKGYLDGEECNVYLCNDYHCTSMMDCDDWAELEDVLKNRNLLTFKAFILNDNKEWQKDLREGKMTVQCVMRAGLTPSLSRIVSKDRFSPTDPDADASSDASWAMDQLKKWDMSDIQYDMNVD
jgi:hypothetical protein